MRQEVREAGSGCPGHDEEMTPAQAVECSYSTRWVGGGRWEGMEGRVGRAWWQPQPSGPRGERRIPCVGSRNLQGKGRGHQTEWGGDGRSVLIRPSHPLATIPQDATSAHRTRHWQVKDALEPTLEHRAVMRLLSPQLLFSELHSGAHALLLVCLKCLLPVSAT